MTKMDEFFAAVCEVAGNDAATMVDPAYLRVVLNLSYGEFWETIDTLEQRGLIDNHSGMGEVRVRLTPWAVAQGERRPGEAPEEPQTKRGKIDRFFNALCEAAGNDKTAMIDPTAIGDALGLSINAYFGVIDVLGARGVIEDHSGRGHVRVRLTQSGIAACHRR